MPVSMVSETGWLRTDGGMSKVFSKTLAQHLECHSGVTNQNSGSRLNMFCLGKEKWMNHFGMYLWRRYFGVIRLSDWWYWMIGNDASSHDRASQENHAKSHPITQEFRLAISMHLIYLATSLSQCDGSEKHHFFCSFERCGTQEDHRQNPKKAQLFLCEKELLVGEFTEEQLTAVVVLLGLRQGFSALGREVT